MREKKKREPGCGVSFGERGALGASLASLLGVEKNASGSGERADDERTERPAKTAEDSAPKPPSRVSLQRRRAGCGGKTVTVVILPQEWRGDLPALAKELRKGLGCGSSIEDGRILLQGDIQERAEAWFIKKGVKKVSRS